MRGLDIISMSHGRWDIGNNFQAAMMGSSNCQVLCLKIQCLNEVALLLVHIGLKTIVRPCPVGHGPVN